MVAAAANGAGEQHGEGVNCAPVLQEEEKKDAVRCDNVDKRNSYIGSQGGVTLWNIS